MTSKTRLFAAKRARESVAQNLRYKSWSKAERSKRRECKTSDILQLFTERRPRIIENLAVVAALESSRRIRTTRLMVALQNAQTAKICCRSL